MVNSNVVYFFIKKLTLNDVGFLVSQDASIFMPDQQTLPHMKADIFS